MEGMERDTVKQRRPCKYHTNTSYYPSGECRRCVNERYLRQKALGSRRIISKRHNMLRRYGLVIE